MKHILITGGSDGLGKVTAQKLIKAGYKVTILSNNTEKTEQAAKELGCEHVVADVSNAEQLETAIRQAVEKGGEIDVLINNAGVWIEGLLEDNDPEQIHKALEVNTLGTIYCTRAVVPAMKKRGSGRIINVISQAGLYAGAERSVYNASKWAITGFTKSMQPELKPFGVSVTGFYPGAMETGIFAKAGDTKERVGMLDPALAADTLVHVCGQPDHVEIPELGIKSLEY
jgi:NAD(P)-dependent dehydrogenase (short-subunit alcohol dehydrogenase family)